MSFIEAFSLHVRLDVLTLISNDIVIMYTITNKYSTYIVINNFISWNNDTFLGHLLAYTATLFQNIKRSRFHDVARISFQL
jgi:hypothetical protein